MASNGLKKVSVASLFCVLVINDIFMHFLFVQSTALMGYPVVHNAREVSVLHGQKYFVYSCLPDHLWLD